MRGALTCPFRGVRVPFAVCVSLSRCVCPFRGVRKRDGGGVGKAELGTASRVAGSGVVGGENWGYFWVKGGRLPTGVLRFRTGRLGRFLDAMSHD